MCYKTFRVVNNINNNYMKKLKIVTLICLSLTLIFAVWQSDAQSRTKVYYSGDAVTFNNNLIFATVNTGTLELFSLEGQKIVRTAMFKPKFVRLPKGSENFHDLQFDVNNGRLYLYLVNGTYLYKFDVSNPYSPKLLEKIRDNAWDWFMQLDKTDDYLVTIGTNGIKYWNNDLQVINSYDLEYQKHENISFSPNGALIFNIVDNTIEVYDTVQRELKTSIWFKAKEEALRGLYYDPFRAEIYIADDIALKVFDLNGKELRRFEHTSDYAYDVEVSSMSNSVYFSDGVGIVRNDKNSLEAIDWKYTSEIGSGKNAWAMDIEVVGDNTGDKVVVFNNSEILVMDSELELIDYFKSSDIDHSPIEALNIRLDKNHGLPGDYVVVSGGGFAMNEEILVQMGKEEWLTSSDSNGRFKRTINVVDIKPQMTDIKVDGVQSGLSYSISFKIN